MSAIEIRDRLIEQRVVPVLRLASAQSTERAVDALLQAGFFTVEITMTTPGAVELIARLAKRLAPEVIVGAGTVLEIGTAQRCIDAGARFLVCPCFVSGIAGLIHAAGGAALLGAFTPSEVLAARREGADIVKIFPASSGGPEHLRAVHAVFPDVALCPTGGVSLQNMQTYFAAGASLVGVGNNIIDQQALAVGDLARLTAQARRFLEPGTLAA